MLALADDRSFGVGYLPAPGTLVVNMSAFAKPVKAEWFNPRTGERLALPQPVPNRGTHEFAPPVSEQDWALLLRAR